MTPINTLVLDIEGTVCPITFVKDTLFPYFLRRLELSLEMVEYPVGKGKGSGSVGTILAGLDFSATSAPQLVAYFTDLVARDVKDPVLKAFQGLVWNQGYDAGELKAPVYADAINEIVQFASRPGNHVYIYSSGSIRAQILLFKHVDSPEHPDLTPCITGYFDITTAGYKTDAGSYQKIIADIGTTEPDSVLFLSDVTKEVRAAIAAGMQSVVVVKPGNAPLTEEDSAEFSTGTDIQEIVSRFTK